MVRARSTRRLAGALAALALAGAALAGASGCGGDDDGGDGSSGDATGARTAPGGTGGDPGTGGGGSGGDPGGGGAAPPGGVDPADVAVIRAWADTLRRGDVSSAARRFALPSAVANGTRPLELTTRAQVEAFNRSLPCGAVLIKTEAAEQGLIVATFRLTERPGAGSCGDGTGHTARTAFLIEDGLITHWLRVAERPPPPGTEA